MNIRRQSQKVLEWAKNPGSLDYKTYVELTKPSDLREFVKH